MMIVDDWKPMARAPNGVTILLAWETRGQDDDFLFGAGELQDGKWLDGPIQPDWWMYCPALPSKLDARHDANWHRFDDHRRPSRLRALTHAPAELALFLFHDMPENTRFSFLRAFIKNPEAPAWLHPSDTMFFIAIGAAVLAPLALVVGIVGLILGKPVIGAILTIYVGGIGTLGLIMALRDIRHDRRRHVPGQRHAP